MRVPRIGSYRPVFLGGLLPSRVVCPFAPALALALALRECQRCVWPSFWVCVGSCVKSSVLAVVSPGVWPGLGVGFSAGVEPEWALASLLASGCAWASASALAVCVPSGH